MTHTLPNDNRLLVDVRHLIGAARQQVASVINAELTRLYWQIGRRINSELLQGQRAEYGKQVIAELARTLTTDFGKGWSERQLRYCLRVAEIFPEAQILHTVCSQLSWSHLRLIIQLDDPLKRDFYLQICQLESWSVRQLQDRINSLLYERTAISKKPEDTIRQDLDLLRDHGQLSPDLTFRDPYVLDFLGLSDSYSEKDLESAIRAFEQVTGLKREFVQDNYSKSEKNVLHGLHYQIQYPHGKIVRAVQGEVFDVAVGLRKRAKTLSQKPWRPRFCVFPNRGAPRHELTASGGLDPMSYPTGSESPSGFHAKHQFTLPSQDEPQREILRERALTKINRQGT